MKLRLISVLLTVVLLLSCIPNASITVSAEFAVSLNEEAEPEPCEHAYEEVIILPSCTEQGYTLHTCVKCGDSYKTDYVYELLHDYPSEGIVTLEPTQTERGILTFICTRCGANKERPLASESEKAHKNEILFISDLHSGRNAENGYHNLRAMFRLLKQYDNFVPEVVSGGGDYLESRTYDDADWPHCYEVMRDIMYNGSPDSVQTLTSGNHDWEWSRQSDEMIEKLLGEPRVGVGYVSDSFEIFHIGAHMNGTGQEKFLTEDIAALRVYLESVVGTGKLIFVHTHWPLHYGYNGSYRATTHADDMIDLLNEYSDRLDICFIWGHNHNQDAMRHRYLTKGDTLRIKSSEYREIQFTYVNAGCLNERHAKEGAGPEDSYYGPGYLLEARIDGDKLIFDYGHITGAYPDPEQAVYDHNSDLLYVPEIQEERPSRFEVPLLHRAECEHDYIAVVTPPSCTEEGFTTYTCSKCGNIVIDDRLAMLGHALIEHEAQAPNCTEPGWDAYQSCLRCDYTSFEELPALGHDLTEQSAKSPTCTEFGWEAYQSCSRCDYTTKKLIEALGHSFDVWVDTTEPSCTEAGTQTRNCTRCNAVESQDIAPLGHVLTNHAPKEPTCTEIGWSAYQSCSRCDYTSYRELPPLGHDFGEWTESRAPGCTEQGILTRVCLRCGETETQSTPALDHDWEEPAYIWSEDFASITANRVCRRDNAHIETETVAAGIEVVRDASFEEEGEIRYTAFFENPAFAVQVKTVSTPKLTKTDALPCDGGDECPGRVFIDMPAKEHWAHDSIDWAIVNKITSGTGENTFSPNEGCTRAQVVTFLWRAASCPLPNAESASGAATQNPFADVKDSAYYYEAVLWATEQGITKGTTETSFSPNSICTRAQIVTFLWRYEGSPNTGADNPFLDVKIGAYYEKAVLWAAEAGVTNGVTATSFQPDAVCTRAQVLTFLYRSVHNHESAVLSY